MQHYLCNTFLSPTHKMYLKNQEKKTEGEKADEPKGFKEQMEELAKYKSPKEMTLLEYKNYLREKIMDRMPPLMGAVICEHVEFSDMALVEMKNNPEIEKMVLDGLCREACKLQRDEKVEYVQSNIRIYHIHDKKTEEKQVLLKKKLRKKRIEIWFEKRAEQREAYTKFLETGERYATPCPAVEMLRAMGNFIGL